MNGTKPANACEVPPTTRRGLLIGSAGLLALACGAAASTSTAVTAPAAGARTNGRKTMGTITTNDGTQLYYKDWGAGRPVVFSHGWPLSSDSWESQMLYLAERG